MYGSDLDSSVTGSGFPSFSNDPHRTTSREVSQAISKADALCCDWNTVGPTLSAVYILLDSCFDEDK
jgi:hypothetical protein